MVNGGKVQVLSIFPTNYAMPLTPQKKKLRDASQQSHVSPPRNHPFPNQTNAYLDITLPLNSFPFAHQVV